MKDGQKRFGPATGGPRMPAVRREGTRRPARGPIALLLLAALLALAAVLPSLARGGVVTRAAFSVASVAPNAMTAGNSAIVTITGTGFDPTAQWTVQASINGPDGPVGLPASAVKVDPSGTALKATILAPTSQLVGTYDLAVTNMATTESLTVPFGLAIKKPLAPLVLRIVPKAAKPGKRVTVYGRNFGRTQDTSQVWFKRCDCGSYVSWSQTKIVVKVPTQHQPGRLPLQIFTAGGISKGRPFTIK
jgi:hypothetical protein